MKSIFFILLLVLPVLAMAQFHKGDIFIGGSFNTGYSKQLKNDRYIGYTQTSISIYPQAAVFLTPRFALGGTLGFGGSHAAYDNSDSYSRSYGVGALGRYFLLAREKFSIALTGSVTYNRTRLKSESDLGYNNVAKMYSLDASIKPTFLFFPSPRWGFEASVGSLLYTHEQNLSTNSNSDEFSARYGTISLGVAYYFRKS
ncbi:MAG TPA: hypothetical protein VIU12_35670 [Chryseolinea sp.]